MCQDICSKHVIITLTLEYQSDECCQQMEFNHKTDCSAHSQVLNLRATSSYEFIETLMPQEPRFHYLSGEFERHFKMFHKKDKDFWHLTTRDSTTWGSFFAQGLVFHRRFETVTSINRSASLLLEAITYTSNPIIPPLITTMWSNLWLITRVRVQTNNNPRPNKGGDKLWCLIT